MACDEGMMRQEELLASLVDSGVEFFIVGGAAAVVHGSSLVAMTLEICCEPSPKNRRRLHTALADLHPRHRERPGGDPLEPSFVESASWTDLRLVTDYGQLDCLGSVPGVGDYAGAKLKSRSYRLAGCRCRVITLDSVICQMEATDSPASYQAVLQLKAIRERVQG